MVSRISHQHHLSCFKNVCVLYTTNPYNNKNPFIYTLSLVSLTLNQRPGSLLMDIVQAFHHQADIYSIQHMAVTVYLGTLFFYLSTAIEQHLRCHHTITVLVNTFLSVSYNRINVPCLLCNQRNHLSMIGHSTVE